jgi:aldose sugar dehydrogenase
MTHDVVVQSQYYGRSALERAIAAPAPRHGSCTPRNHSINAQEMIMTFIRQVVAGGAWLVLAGFANSQAPSETGAPAAEGTLVTQHHEVRVERIADGLEHPWGMDFLPDGRFLVTERNAGNLRIGQPGGELSEPVRGVPDIFRYEGDTPRSQAGLFDVKLHPDFANNRLVYLSLSLPTERGTGTSIVRGRLVEDDNGARLEGVEAVFEMNEDDQDSSGLHFGGRMLFLPDDSLLLSIGERRNISRSQDLEDQAGSIIRIADDGSVPRDNPFVGDDSRDDKIFTAGHRNPQGIAWDPQNDEIWINDHGPLGGDEINRLQIGRNYGWPYLTGGVDYSGAPIGVGLARDGMESPFYVFEDTVAPSGLVVYGGDEFPAWRGDLLNGGMRAEALVRVRVLGDRVAEVEHIVLDRRIRDVATAEDGSVWLLTEHEDGEVLRLSAAN